MISSKKNRMHPAIISSLIALIAIGGCSAANYGNLRSTPEVTRSFETYQILPDHKYYYRGTYSRPFVIVGINSSYALSSPLWVEIDPKSEDFRKLIDRVSLQGSSGTTQPWGFTILDKSGKEVGVWYSASRSAAVEIDEKGRILNLSPLLAVTKGEQK